MKNFSLSRGHNGMFVLMCIVNSLRIAVYTCWHIDGVCLHAACKMACLSFLLIRLPLGRFLELDFEVCASGFIADPCGVAGV